MSPRFKASSARWKLILLIVLLFISTTLILARFRAHEEGPATQVQASLTPSAQGYQTNWKGLRNDQRAALQKAGLVTKRGQIKPEE
jgi:hypothetical protein